MLRNSIRARLIVGVLLVQLALAVGVVTLGVYGTKTRLRSSLDAALQSRAMRVAALVRYSEDHESKIIFDGSLLPPSFDARFSDFFEIRTADGNVLARSRDWNNEIQPNLLRPNHARQLRIGGAPYRAVRVDNIPILDREQDLPDPGNISVFYAIPAEGMNEEVWEAGITLGGAALALTVFTGFVAWWAIRRSLSPLDQLATSAAEINARNWELRVPRRESTPDELMPLINAMGTMLANLQDAFRQQRDFVANAAHELKTPLAIVKSSLQSLQQRPRSTEEYHAGIDESLDDLARLERLIQQLLRLARAEQWVGSETPRNVETINLADTCHQAIARLRGVAKARNIDFEVQAIQSTCFVKADPDDLEIVWANLLENAIHYSPEGSSIAVAVEGTGASCRVVVSDHGPGVTEEELGAVFERFHRGDPSRARNTGGFGLGLAIAKALVEAYQGRIYAESVVGNGTRMIVELSAETVPQAESLSLN